MNPNEPNHLDQFITAKQQGKSIMPESPEEAFAGQLMELAGAFPLDSIFDDQLRQSLQAKEVTLRKFPMQPMTPSYNPRWQPRKLMLIAASLVLVLFAALLFMASSLQEQPVETTLISAAQEATAEPETTQEVSAEFQLGDTVTGTIDPDGSQIFTLTAPAGTSMEIILFADRYLELSADLTDSEGNTTTESNLGDTLPEQRLPMRFEEETEVAITIASEQPIPTDFTLRFYPIEKQVIEAGETITFTLDREHPTLAYNFNAHMGQTVRIRFDSDEPIYLEKVSPRNSLYIPNLPVEELSAIWSFRVANEEELIFRLPFYVPTAENMEETRVTFSIEPVYAEEITYGVGQFSRISEVQGAVSYRFEGERGETIDIVLNSVNDYDTDLRLRLLDERNQVVAEDDDSGAFYLPELLNFQLDRSGLYLLQIEAIDSTESIPIMFNLFVSAVTMPSLDEGIQVVELGGKENHYVAFLTADAGETIRLGAIPSEDAREGFVMVTASQNGESLTTMYIHNGTTEAEFTVPEAGRVLVSVNWAAGKVETIDQLELSVTRED